MDIHSCRVTSHKHIFFNSEDFYLNFIPDCDTDSIGQIEFSKSLTGPSYYSYPGPITLTCKATGDIQSIKWIRKRSDGIEQELESKVTINNSSNYWLARLENYLLSKDFPFTYRCEALGICCNRQQSNPKIVKLRPGTAVSSKWYVVTKLACYGHGYFEFDCQMLFLNRNYFHSLTK